MKSIFSKGVAIALIAVPLFNVVGGTSAQAHSVTPMTVSVAQANTCAPHQVQVSFDFGETQECLEPDESRRFLAVVEVCSGQDTEATVSRRNGSVTWIGPGMCSSFDQVNATVTNQAG